ncbi:heptaprenyl diphosphate synthase component 1 [Brevibacillus daliensis]|uniref:heptaprenyl diphosphate synthase component 1 n=1 Tax=Brevibacillus daliensis TaxID=2892995 RepID=UPI001E58C6F3|nr:heptaprenyl diphosphate synthase component 1 [Brevibacillus daliensis]
MSTERTTLLQETKELLEDLKKMASHSYIQHYTDIPALKENRLALLYFFLNENGFTKERARILTIATGLVQLGIDTHETVKNQYEKNNLIAERNRQLTVLSGDYYSALYYHLLADQGEVEAIRTLAMGNQMVHETKMKLYLAERDNKMPLETYLSLRKTIDTALYVAIVNQYAKEEQMRAFWISLFEQTSAFEQLMGEWEQLEWQDQSPGRMVQFLLQKPGVTLALVLDTIENRVMDLLQVCDQLLKNWKPTEKQSDLEWVTSRFTNRVQRLKRAEEM